MTLNILLGMVGPFQVLILLLLFGVLFVLPVILCIKQAEKVNRDQTIWGILGFLLGYIAVLILFLSGEPNEPKRKQTHITLCPFCGEEIYLLAKKCKHCGEWIEGK